MSEMDINKPCSIVDLTGDLWGTRRNIRVCLCITAGTSRRLLSVCQAKILGCFWYFLNVFFFLYIVSSRGWLLAQMWTQQASFTRVRDDQGRNHGIGCRVFR